MQWARPRENCEPQTLTSHYVPGSLYLPRPHYRPGPLCRPGLLAALQSLAFCHWPLVAWGHLVAQVGTIRLLPFDGCPRVARRDRSVTVMTGWMLNLTDSYQPGFISTWHGRWLARPVAWPDRQCCPLEPRASSHHNFAAADLGKLLPDITLCSFPAIDIKIGDITNIKIASAHEQVTGSCNAVAHLSTFHRIFRRREPND